jgi:hypothetical protein
LKLGQVRDNQSSMNQLALALTACARVLRPVVRLAMGLGLKQPHLQELLNELLLDEAQRSWQAKGVHPNLSQLSITTGINRKAVTARVRTPRDPLAPTELSSASKTLTMWLEMATDNEDLRTLPVVSEGKAPSFESVAWIGSRGNVHHRVILEELVRLGMVTDHGARVELNADGFIPVNDLSGMLAFFADNGRDHLSASVSNILAERPPMLERSIYAYGLPLEACEEIHQLVRARWSTLHHELAHEMRAAIDTDSERATARIRVGIYTYFEDGAGPSEEPTDASSRDDQKS